MENRNIIQDKNILSQVHDLSIDTTDNANDKYFKSAKFISSSNIKTDIQQNDTKTSSKSFIQQRVERLYGPGALAQGFYSPKKVKSQEISILSERTSNSQIKYSTKTISIEHDITTVGTTTSITSTTPNGKSTTTSSLERIVAAAENCENFKNGSCDLPVMRHLRPEFRAQLPLMSPKRSPNKFPVNESSSCPVLLNGTSLYTNGGVTDELNSASTTSKITTIHHHSSVVDPKKVTTVTNGNANNINNNNSLENNVIAASGTAVATIKSIDDMKQSEKVTQESECDKNSSQQQQQSLSVSHAEQSSNAMTGNTTALINSTEEKENCKIQDGNYFLVLLKTEQDRLLILAERTETEMASLSVAEVSDDIFGYLRSAAGKARLLVTQKMKQFEGLCKNNLNRLPGEKFPTTNEDLQGFWDMVMLQVYHVDSLFKEIENLKANNWQKPVQDVPNPPPQGSKLIRRPHPSKSSSNTTSNGGGGNSSVANGASSKKSQASLLAAQRREAQRKQLMEMKRKNKMAKTVAEQQEQQMPQPNQSQVVEIFVNEPCSS